VADELVVFVVDVQFERLRFGGKEVVEDGASWRVLGCWLLGWERRTGEGVVVDADGGFRLVEERCGACCVSGSLAKQSDVVRSMARTSAVDAWVATTRSSPWMTMSRMEVTGRLSCSGSQFPPSLKET
jgi:hypothetical protein